MSINHLTAESLKQVAESCPRISYLVGLELDLGFCTSSKFSGDAAAAAEHLHFENLWSSKLSAGMKIW